MKFPSVVCGSLLATALFGCVVPLASAQDLTPPVVVAPVKDMTVAPNSAPVILDLSDIFGLEGVKGQMVRMTTNLGKIDVELFNDVAPDTAANFLQYVTADSYTDTIFHEVKSNAAGQNKIVLGGSFALTGASVTFITTFGNVDNEFSLPDTRGTLAMYKQSSSPDSATDEWFFNVTDNSAKFGSSHRGGYTVFGRVIGNGMQRVDAIAALKTYDLSTIVGGKAFKSTPLYNYDPSQTIAANNLVVATRVAELPLFAQNGSGGALKVTVTGDTDANVATAQVSGGVLIVKPVAGQMGTTVITLQAKDQAKTKVTVTFNVTVL